MPKEVSIFVTCVVDQLFPNVGLAMAAVLERLGYRVHFPGSADLLWPARIQQWVSRRGRKSSQAFLKRLSRF